MRFIIFFILILFSVTDKKARLEVPLKEAKNIGVLKLDFSKTVSFVSDMIVKRRDFDSVYL